MGWKAKAPDMTAQNNLAKTQTDIALEQAGMAREERAFQREQMDRVMPLFEQQINASIESQKTADQRSGDQWQRYLTAFAPAEDKLATQALTYDTPERRATAAAEAVAGVDTQFQRVRDTQRRDLGRAGISLDSGRALTLDMATSFGQAKAAAGADRTARQQIENTGMSLVDNVAKLGRGLAGTSLQAQGLGLNAGSAATGQLGQQQGAYNSSLQPVAQFYSGATGALGSATNMYNGINQQKQAADGAAMNGLLGLGKLAATVYTSDPKTKKVHGEVSGKKALGSLEDAKVKKWTYKAGKGDGGTHIGRMAGKNDVDTPDGKGIDVISELGTHHAAIKQLSLEVAKISKAVRKDISEDETETA
jgi:hypothetical protein